LKLTVAPNTNNAFALSIQAGRSLADNFSDFDGNTIA
jgi:hypothetical protein